MTETSKDQVSHWLKKLERESWQLELLVSAFTIFLLIQAIDSYTDFLMDIQYEYNLGDSLLSFVFIFLSLLSLAIKALAMFLILHLMLRGFWIGAIGLRSVQSVIHFEKLNYSDYFTDKLKNKVISLDNLVIMLDEICSLMFSFAFLIISVLLSFGLYMLFMGATAVSLSAISSLASGSLELIITIFNVILVFTILITGLIYFIDYFTLGFFKKFKWLSKIYYPFYRFYGAITLAVISRSIYYYLISKFSKRRIRIVYFVAGTLILFSFITEYNQYQYYPKKGDAFELVSNQYDNLRPSKQHIAGASIQSNVVDGKFLQLFIRYDPKDNSKIKSLCSELVPLKDEGFNWKLKVVTQNNSFFIRPQDYESEDKEKLLECLGSLYQITINDSIYNDVKFYFFEQPDRNQKGIITLLSADQFVKGENHLVINKVLINEDGIRQSEDYASIPFWYHKP